MADPGYRPTPLTPDELLTTTRAVRKRLDLERPLDPALVDECLAIAQQAPTGGNRQTAVFVVVTDPALRARLGELYLSGWERYAREGVGSGAPVRVADDPRAMAAQRRITESARYLAENLHRVPVHVIPCVRPRTDDDATIAVQASTFGSVLPAAWSYMLAARSRGLGTVLTTIHLFHEREAAELLGIPDNYMQVGLIPTGHLIGTTLKPGPRKDLDEFRRLNAWG